MWQRLYRTDKGSLSETSVQSPKKLDSRTNEGGYLLVLGRDGTSWGVDLKERPRINRPTALGS